MEHLMSLEAQRRLIEGARKGGKSQKHFTPESKQRQLEGARRGGLTPKHFTPESKERQILGAQKGGQHSHMHDYYPPQEVKTVSEKPFKPMSTESQQALIDGASKGGKIGGRKTKTFTPESKERQIIGAIKGGTNSHGGHPPES